MIDIKFHEVSLEEAHVSIQLLMIISSYNGIQAVLEISD